MTSQLTNKKGKVIVVDPSGPVRAMMTETVRTIFGFESVEGKASIQDVINHLEVDSATWIILPPMADQPVNGLHLLKILTEYPDLRSIRASLCVEEQEEYLLPSAYQLGLLSHHRRPFTKESLTDDLKSMVQILDTHNYHETLVSAHYLRQYLKASKDQTNQLVLERRLLHLLPGHTPTMMHLAELQIASNDHDRARQSLHQLKLLDPKLADKITDMMKSLGNSGAPAADGQPEPEFNVLGIKTAVVIDSDEAISKATEDSLKALGIASVKRFNNGEEAWADMDQNPEPELIITEWRVPRLSGPLLIQRIRHKGFLNVPILIQSSLLKPEDMPAVREIGIANIIPKPFRPEVFYQAVITTMQQERLPTENQAMERKILTFLRAGKKAEAEPLKAQFLADPRVTPARRNLVEGEFAFQEGKFLQARDFGLEALKLTPNNILVLNLLGKTFMRLAAFDAALKCFKKAQDLSPQNLERLCMMAEAQTELGNDAAAKEAVTNAKKIDAGAAVIVESEVKIAIKQGDTDAARKLMSGFDSIDNIIAYMNNRAVAHALAGERLDAIGLYKKTLESIPAEQTEPRAVVLYNLALAQVKDNEFEAALGKLADLGKLPENKMSKKAKSLHSRLKAARDKGEPFKLRSTENSSNRSSPAVNAGNSAAAAPAAAGGPSAPIAEAGSGPDEESRRVQALVEARPGEVCCFLIFEPAGTPDPRVAALLAKSPRYKSRDAISRAESLGADRVAKGA